METITRDVAGIKARAAKLDVPTEYVDDFHEWYLQHRLPCCRSTYRPEGTGWKRLRTIRNRLLYACIFLFITSTTLTAVNVLQNSDMDFNALWDEMINVECVVENNMLIMEATRPVADCQTLCGGMTEFPIYENISREDFMRLHAYTGKPALIRGATNAWTAPETFSYDFFKKLYLADEDILKQNDEQCQFFPYKTEFVTLGDVFNMSDERATFQPGQDNWYIGWSNCNPDIERQIREHYQRPYFLPEESESTHVDWLFMGGPGDGAHIHIDQVQRPSWQALIRGSKTWHLYPVPECESVCPRYLNATMKRGDIIIVDTNQWYHATTIHPGDISISLVSEFD